MKISSKQVRPSRVPEPEPRRASAEKYLGKPPKVIIQPEISSQSRQFVIGFNPKVFAQFLYTFGADQEQIENLTVQLESKRITADPERVVLADYNRDTKTIRLFVDTIERYNEKILSNMQSMLEAGRLPSDEYAAFFSSQKLRDYLQNPNISKERKIKFLRYIWERSEKYQLRDNLAHETSHFLDDIHHKDDLTKEYQLDKRLVRFSFLLGFVPVAALAELDGAITFSDALLAVGFGVVFNQLSQRFNSYRGRPEELRAERLSSNAHAKMNLSDAFTVVDQTKS